MLVVEDVVYHGDAYTCLSQLEDSSLSLVITSPPYWRQRDYGFKGQVGWESTPEDYIGRLIRVFQVLHRKLRDDGVFFLNVGDKYLSRYGKSHLLQIPYRLAYHLVHSAWRLEDVIIWYKPNHMPSPAKDRFTNAYEPVLVLTKSRKNRYFRLCSVVKVRLQQTPWLHTAVFPERLVEELIKRFRLEDGDIVVDPFAGTGTVAYVVRKLRRSLNPVKAYSVMIDRGEEYVRIIMERAGVKRLVRVEEEPYDWEPVRDGRIPEVEPLEVKTCRYGEVFIADDHETFLRALKGMASSGFREYHREDALYFYGVVRWSIESLYYTHAVIHEGYVLRNMIVASDGCNWYPVFMLARDTTITPYRFFLDRVRVKPKTAWAKDWWSTDFTGAAVKDSLGKKRRTGVVSSVLERYWDGFPMIVAVSWGDSSSIEPVIHPEEETRVMEGLKFKCPKCRFNLDKPYDPEGDVRCPGCGVELWRTIDTAPLIVEPPIAATLSTRPRIPARKSLVEKDLTKARNNRRGARSKFRRLDRLNWGASPGARKTIVGEYFIRVRLYKIEQPVVAMYLNLLRREKGLTIGRIVEKLPAGYRHTVGHWFRRDFGGSIPVPEDIPLLTKVLGEHGILRIIGKTALKLQTVKTSPKGKNPGDYIEIYKPVMLKRHLQKLYLPRVESEHKPFKHR